MISWRIAWPQPERSGAQPARGDLSRHVLGAATRDIDLEHTRELAHPGQLATGVVARAALHPLDVAGQQVVEAKRLARRRAGRPPALAAAPPARLPRPASRRRGRRSARRGARGRRPARPAAWDGASPASTARTLPLRRLELAGLVQLERADDPVAVGRSDLGRSPRRPRRQALRAAPPGRCDRSACGPALAHAVERRRLQRQVRKRGSQVEPRSADDDRPAALRPAVRRSRCARAPRTARR